MWWRRLRWLLLLTALCAFATCPIGWRACRKTQREREAEPLLRYLAKQALRDNPAQLPRTPAGPTPAPGACCDQGGQCAVEPNQWQTPGWKALAFSIDDPHRYSYSYQPTPDGGGVFRAVGDVDCDGTQ